jgi:hypothetical protein
MASRCGVMVVAEPTLCICALLSHLPYTHINVDGSSTSLHPPCELAIKFSSDSVMAGVKSGLRFIDLHKQFTNASAVTSKCYAYGWIWNNLNAEIKQQQIFVMLSKKINF